MLRVGFFAALLIAQSPLVMAQACPDSTPVIQSATVGGAQDNGNTKTYIVQGTVVNRSSHKQAGNVLQSIEVLQDGQKINEIGIPPLGPGRSYEFHQSVVRSSIAGKGTTHLSFQLREHSPQSCTQENVYHLRV
ncbi:MAG TPA: hypothetical protein VME66_09480 [Candidatus Acidoferrales bacterium]|nr:hypothetical protein [Candidatus Acidoferrales bacterium]